MSTDLLALAQRHDPASRDELAARLTSLERGAGLGGRARLELEALLRELRHQVSSRMREAIDASLGEPDRRDRRPSRREDELAGLALGGHADRLVALARRPDLPSRVSAIIAARGYLPALHALARNPSAQLGHSVLLALADLSLGDPGLRGAAIRRHDLPEEAISLLWPHLSDDEKAALLRAREPYGELDLDEIAVEAELRLHEKLRKGELPASFESVCADIDAGNLDPAEAVEHLCADGRFADLAELMARLLSCASLPCLNLLAMPTPRGAAILCRAAGLPRESHELVARLRSDLGWQAPTTASTGSEAFDSLSRNAARRILAPYVEEGRR